MSGQAGDGLQHGDRTDRSKQKGPTIQVALARRKATDPTARVGSMLFGRGDPGDSGVSLIKQGEMNRPEML
ncbi:hypothetical protein [Nonomuraea sp. NPDC049625]|uniref:hypothetical protein n=1 Tax=Nonomuraea sp. NPDC049625 TaxID=3155775 RepID=UPI003416640F